MKNFKGVYMDGAKRNEILDAVLNPSVANAELRHELRKTLPRQCFVGGNKSIFDVDAIKKYISSEDDISFAMIAARRWRKEILEFDDPCERHEALRAVAVRDFGASLPKRIATQVAAIMGVEIEKPRTALELNEIRDYVFDMIEGITRGEAEAKEAMLKGTPEQHFATKIEANMVANINRLVASSKSKKLAAMGVHLVADPSKDVTQSIIGNAYGDYRPDMILSYNEDGERKNILHEHFGWKGSKEYNDKQMEKTRRAVDAGLAIFVSCEAPSYHHRKSCHPDECSLYKRVWDWNLEKTYFSPDVATACFKAFYSMMEYAGLQRYVPAIENIYFE